MISNTSVNNTSTSLSWLEGLPPGYFALVMSSGIISYAFHKIGIPMLADALYVLTLLAWMCLIFLSVWRVIRFPQAVKIDLLSIRRVFAYFTLVVATSIVGVLLNLHGWYQLAIFCWIFSFLIWSTLLYLSFSVLTFLTHETSVNVVHGDWLTSIVATQALVLLGAQITPQLGEYAGYMLIEIHMLWMLGLSFYSIFITLFCYRIFFLSFKPEDTSPLLWVIMGAAAVSANAGTSLLVTETNMPFLLALKPFIDGVSLMLWAWSTWWIPMLIIFGLWKHAIRHYPLRYEPALWSMVFPLGMYAVASFKLGLATGFSPLEWISRSMVWVAFGTLCLVMLGMLLHLFGSRKTAGPL